mgnify:CR=1 FL=1
MGSGASVANIIRDPDAVILFRPLGTDWFYFERVLELPMDALKGFAPNGLRPLVRRGLVGAVAGIEVVDTSKSKIERGAPARSPGLGGFARQDPIWHGCRYADYPL